MTSTIRAFKCVLCQDNVAEDEVGIKLNDKHIICLSCYIGDK